MIENHRTAVGDRRYSAILSHLLVCSAAAGSERAKPECPLNSESLNSRLYVQSRIRILERPRLIGLVFCISRPGNRTKQRQVRALMGSERLPAAG
jgi:hypothetical protein